MIPSAQGGAGGLRDLNLTNKLRSLINNKYALVHFARINTLILRESSLKMSHILGPYPPMKKK
jgi:hypothetical protein